MNRHEEDPRRAREANASWPERAREESKLLRTPEPQENVRQPLNQVRRSMLVGLLTLVLTIVLTVGGAQAAGLSGKTWSIVPSPNNGRHDNVLSGVAAVSATN